MAERYQFLPVPDAAFPEVTVFAVVMCEFLDLASCHALDFLEDGYGVSQ